MKQPDWSQIFAEKIISTHHEGGGKTNDVWQIKTEQGIYIVKIPRISPHPKKGFAYGLYTLFRLDEYRDVIYQCELAEFIDHHSPLAVPRVVRIDTSREKIPKPYVIHEQISGEPVNFKQGLDTRQLVKDLGDHLGSLDQANFAYWGNFQGDPKLAWKDWPHQFIQAMKKMAARRFPGDDAITYAIREAEERTHYIADPDRGSLIMLDLKGGQFLQQDGRLKALVDIGSHVIGPRELGWVTLEYVIRPEDADALMSGYTRHLSVPEIGTVRQIYRLLEFLMFTEVGSFSDWMNQPEIFN